MKNNKEKVESKDNLLPIIQSLWFYIGRRRQYQFLLILFLTILSAFAEALSLGALLPFLGVLVAPEKIFNNPVVHQAAEFFELRTPASIVLPLTVFFISAVIFAAMLRVAHFWATIKVTFGCGADLSVKLYDSVLHKPYQELMTINTSSIISSVAKIDIAVNVLSQIVRLISSIILVVSIVCALLFINSYVAFATFITFGSVYFFITLSFKSRIRKNSIVISANKTQVLKSLQEGLGGIRDVILDRTQAIFREIYRQADQPLRKAEASNSFIEGSPRYIMESLGMIIIALLAYMLSVHWGGVEQSIPLLGALALGAQRLLPALQQGYNSLTAISGHYASLLEVVTMLRSSKNSYKEEKTSNTIKFTETIELNNIYFRYEKNQEWVLNDISIKVEKGNRVGIVGSTGSGKSTLLDVKMGFLSPENGVYSVDGKVILKEEISSWQKNISHVPQSIYLTDGSFIENIAFGIPESEANINKVKEVSQKAQLKELIEKQKLGYRSLVGERGVKLSGGQRQRIGIARALYKESSIIVFDEATSALDHETEQLIMNAIENLGSDTTIFLVAHRLSTIKHCDVIYVLENGVVVDSGNYEELKKRSNFFKSA